MLVQLLYASRAASEVTAEMAESILQVSRTRNPGLGITGLLCHGGDVFMQVLEGGRGPVNDLYNRIVRDARHQQMRDKAAAASGTRSTGTVEGLI